jgi:glucose/mannose transport system substrate-binding protein
MKLKFKITQLAALTTLAFAGSAFATDVEVLHYWTSGGEAKSVGQLQQIVKPSGYGWKDFAVAGGGGDNAMTALKTRVVSGNPPTAAQIKGPAIQEWGAEGVLANIDDAAKAEMGQAVLPKVVADIMKYKGHYVAAPVNVHRVNWLWVNPEVLKKPACHHADHLGRILRSGRKAKSGGIADCPRRPAVAGRHRV